MAGSDIVRSVASGVERLLEENRRLKGESEKLSSRNEKLRAENRDLAGRIAVLEQRINVLELREGLTGGGNNRQAITRINRLMREVDKCIALLNR